MYEIEMYKANYKLILLIVGCLQYDVKERVSLNNMLKVYNKKVGIEFNI